MYHRLIKPLIYLAILPLVGCFPTSPNVGTIDFGNYDENYYDFRTSKLAIGLTEEQAVASLTNTRGENLKFEVYESTDEMTVLGFNRWQAMFGFDKVKERLFLLFENDRLKSWSIAKGKASPPNEWPTSPGGTASDEYSQRRIRLADSIELNSSDDGYRIGVTFDELGTIWDLSEHAIQSGLQLGDIVMEFSDVPIRSFPNAQPARSQMLHDLVNKSASQNLPISLSIQRNGSTLRLLVDPIDTSDFRIQMMTYVSSDDWGALSINSNW